MKVDEFEVVDEMDSAVVMTPGGRISGNNKMNVANDDEIIVEDVTPYEPEEGDEEDGESDDTGEDYDEENDVPEAVPAMLGQNTIGNDLLDVEDEYATSASKVAGLEQVRGNDLNYENGKEVVTPAPMPPSENLEGDDEIVLEFVNNVTKGE